MATRTNLCTNPSFETGTTGWVGAAALATTTSQALVGSQSLQVTATNNGLEMSVRFTFPVTAGVTYAIQGRSRAATTGRSVSIYTWANSQAAASAAAGSNSTSGWATHSRLWTPTESGTGNVKWWWLSVPLDEVHYFDAVLIEAASSIGSYFDGDTTDTASATYSWTGTAHASTSTEVVINNGAAIGGYSLTGLGDGSSFATPGGLVASAVSTSQIDLTWNAVSDALWYEVERDGVVIARWLTTNSYSDTGLTPGTSYTYRVRAVKNHV